MKNRGEAPLGSPRFFLRLLHHKDDGKHPPMPVTIEIKFFASLKKYLPPNSASRYVVEPGTPLSVVFDQLRIPKDQVKLIFIDGVKEDANVLLHGGERVGVFPPIGGG